MRRRAPIGGAKLECFNNFLFDNMPYRAYLLNIKDKHFFRGTHENFNFNARNQKVSVFSFCFISLESRFCTIRIIRILPLVSWDDGRMGDGMDRYDYDDSILGFDRRGPGVPG